MLWGINRHKRKPKWQSRMKKQGTSVNRVEDTKRVIKIRKSKKDRQHHGHKKRNKGTDNDLENITHTTKDGVTRTQL